MKPLKQYIIESFLLEGGAAGHMLHPFQLDFISSVEDLLSYFNNLYSALSEGLESFVKIDGTNCSIRLRGTEFVLDRMTKDPMDVNGMDVEDVKRRYAGSPYGYGDYAVRVLEAFNECYPKITKELKALGMIDDPTLMFNLEFVDGKTNIVEFDNSFIAIHGLLQIETTHTGARKTTEVKSNRSLLESIAKKMNRILRDIEVITQVPALVDSTADFDEVYNSQIRININNEYMTKSLKEWSQEYPVEKKEVSVKTVDGKRISAMQLSVLRRVIAGEDVASLIDNSYIDKYLSNFFLLYANLLFGRELLEHMTSKFGRGSNQEGIVVRDNNINRTEAPVKITGTFVLQNKTNQ